MRRGIPTIGLVAVAALVATPGTALGLKSVSTDVSGTMTLFPDYNVVTGEVDASKQDCRNKRKVSVEDAVGNTVGSGKTNKDGEFSFVVQSLGNNEAVIPEAKVAVRKTSTYKCKAATGDLQIVGA